MLIATDSVERIELVLDSDLMKKMPQWAPDEGDPPLSVAKAAILAKKWARENYKTADRVEIRQISLTSLGCSGITDRWYYVVEFLSKVNGVPKFEPGNWVAVLLDGRVIGPTRSIAPK